MSTLTVIKRYSSFFEKKDEIISMIEYTEDNRIEKFNEAVNLAKSHTDRQWITCVVLDSELPPFDLAWDTGADFSVAFD